MLGGGFCFTWQSPMDVAVALEAVVLLMFCRGVDFCLGFSYYRAH